MEYVVLVFSAYCNLLLVTLIFGTFPFVGGVFGLFDGRMDPLFASCTTSTNEILCWGDVNDPVPCWSYVKSDLLVIFPAGIITLRPKDYNNYHQLDDTSFIYRRHSPKWNAWHSASKVGILFPLKYIDLWAFVFFARYVWNITNVRCNHAVTDRISNVHLALDAWHARNNPDSWLLRINTGFVRFMENLESHRVFRSGKLWIRV